MQSQRPSSPSAKPRKLPWQGPDGLRVLEQRAAAEHTPKERSLERPTHRVSSRKVAKFKLPSSNS
jgi:hypothetical protein